MHSSLVLLFSLLIFSSLKVCGQSDSTFSKPVYFNAIYSGAMFGKKGYGTSFSASTIHGIRKKYSSLGLGIGYDAYRDWVTMPIFASYSCDFNKLRTKNFFLQMKVGYSFAWFPTDEDYWLIYDSHGGIIIEPLFGYRIILDRVSLYISAGYKWQRVKYEEKIRGWDNPSSRVTTQREFQRLTFQLGFGLR